MRNRLIAIAAATIVTLGTIAPAQAVAWYKSYFYVSNPAACGFYYGEDGKAAWYTGQTRLVNGKVQYKCAKNVDPFN